MSSIPTHLSPAAAAAYGAAFAERMKGHGEKRSEVVDGVVVTTLVDRRAEAHAWALVVVAAMEVE